MPISITNDPTQTPLDRAIDRWWEASNAIESWQVVKDSASAEILSLLPAGESAGGISVTAGRRRFSPELAARALTATQFAGICEFVPSAKLARAKLDGPVLDACYETVGSPYVRRT